MASFKDIMEVMAGKKAPVPSKDFWARFDRELSGRLDAVDVRNPRRGYGLADFFTAFLRPRPVFATIAAAVILNLAVFSLANRNVPLTTVAFLSSDDLIRELVLTDQLVSGENIVDF